MPFLLSGQFWQCDDKFWSFYTQRERWTRCTGQPCTLLVAVRSSPLLISSGARWDTTQTCYSWNSPGMMLRKGISSCPTTGTRVREASVMEMYKYKPHIFVKGPCHWTATLTFCDCWMFPVHAVGLHIFKGFFSALHAASGFRKFQSGIISTFSKLSEAK